MNKLLNAFEGLLAPLGRSLRYAANELDRYGCSLERNFAPFEELNRHRRLMSLGNTKPTLGTNVFVAPNAAVVGDVTIGKDSTVWYGAVLRGDVNHIQIGNKTSIGDNSIIHVAKNSPSGPQPTVIGDNVVVDTGAIIHACKLEDGCRVEAGAVVFDGVVVEKNAIVGAGSVVPTGKRIPAGQYWAGNPAKFVRNVSDAEKTELANLVNQHFTLAKKHWDVHQMTEQEKYYDLKQTDKSPPEIIPRTF